MHHQALSFTNFTFCPESAWGRDSSVGIVTGYGLDGPRIESRWRRDFSHTSRPALRPTQPPVQWVPGLSQGEKRPGRGADHPPYSSVEVKKEWSYTSTPLWAFGPVTGYLHLNVSSHVPDYSIVIKITVEIKPLLIHQPHRAYLTPVTAYKSIISWIKLLPAQVTSFTSNIIKQIRKCPQGVTLLARSVCYLPYYCGCTCYS
jgi:hypothetical protein